MGQFFGGLYGHNAQREALLQALRLRDARMEGLGGEAQ